MDVLMYYGWFTALPYSHRRTAVSHLLLLFSSISLISRDLLWIRPLDLLPPLSL